MHIPKFDLDEHTVVFIVEDLLYEFTVVCTACEPLKNVF